MLVSQRLMRLLTTPTNRITWHRCKPWRNRKIVLGQVSWNNITIMKAKWYIINVLHRITCTLFLCISTLFIQHLSHPFIYQPFYLHFYLFFFPATYISINLSVYHFLSIYQSIITIYLSNNLSYYLSTCYFFISTVVKPSCLTNSTQYCCTQMLTQAWEESTRVRVPAHLDDPQ